MISSSPSLRSTVIPPSVREIGAAMGLKSPSTVHFHLKGLEEAGMIVKAEGKTRAITLPAAPTGSAEDPTPGRTGSQW